VNSVERDANHILHRFLGDLTANAFVEANEGLTMTLQTTES
jgi:hypothetical protein